MRRPKVRVLDEKGRPLADAGVSTYVNGKRRFSTRTDEEGRSYSIAIFADATTTWTAQASGYRSVVREDLTMRDAPNELVFHLSPGWGTYLDLVDERGAPIAGARVSLDGSFAGTTDEFGHLLLEAPSRPARISIDHPDYELAWGNIDSESGAPDPAVTTLPSWVVMKARDAR